MTDQKLIIINGLLNSGKTLVFDLFVKEDNYICLDIGSLHLQYYEQYMIDKLGKETAARLKLLIESDYLFLDSVFLNEIGMLMKKYPECNFVIKPGGVAWARNQNNKEKFWLRDVRRLLPIDIKNIHNLYIFRHPYMAWTTTFHEKIDVGKFVSLWFMHLDELEDYQVIKIEELVHYSFLKKLIKKTDLSKVLTYSRFDLKTKLINNYKNLKLEFLYIRRKLEPLKKYLNYDVVDENIQLFMDDDLSNYPEE